LEISCVFWTFIGTSRIKFKQQKFSRKFRWTVAEF